MFVVLLPNVFHTNDMFALSEKSAEKKTKTGRLPIAHYKQKPAGSDLWPVNRCIPSIYATQARYKAVQNFGWTPWTELLSVIALFLISLAPSRFMIVAVVFLYPIPLSVKHSAYCLFLSILHIQAFSTPSSDCVTNTFRANRKESRKTSPWWVAGVKHTCLHLYTTYNSISK